MADSKRGTREMEFRVTGVLESGLGRFNVNLSQTQFDGTSGAPVPTAPFPNSITLNLSEEEANGFFPGQVYKMTLSPA